eukprot:7471694-Karenia_brevis.AAC.1
MMMMLMMMMMMMMMMMVMFFFTFTHTRQQDTLSSAANCLSAKHASSSTSVRAVQQWSPMIYQCLRNCVLSGY